MKQKKELAVLVVLLVIAGNIWYWFFFREGSGSPTTAAAAVQNYKPLGVENPEPVTVPLDLARKTEYSSSGRNIFSREIPPKPPTPAEIKKTQEIQAAQAAQLAAKPPEQQKVAPLPVKYFGYGVVPSGTSRRAFFTDGENVYIVSEGEILMNRFRILKIGNSNLEYEEIASGLHGTVPLEEESPASPLAASAQ
jgi:hypothetical protein